MDNPPYPIGSVMNGHVMTTQGWVMLGTRLQGSVMTPTGWVKDATTDAGRLGAGIAIGAAGLLVGIIGLIMANASVSLMTGTGTNWTGAAITIIAVISATLANFLIKAPLWTTIVTGAVGLLLVVLSVVSVIYLEVQLEDRRQELEDVFGAPTQGLAPSPIAQA
ncbi:hypothetical protein [Nocardioides pelophilus]|uniref:hypothetical protein n=1 Tax=Nocardioides pelophilus TaxID=2172019 RepID=UPI0016041B41|nr:hypothetical protein [Nocardioides pelophilus]